MRRQVNELAVVDTAADTAQVRYRSANGDCRAMTVARMTRHERRPHSVLAKRECGASAAQMIDPRSMAKSEQKATVLESFCGSATGQESAVGFVVGAHSGVSALRTAGLGLLAKPTTINERGAIQVGLKGIASILLLRPHTRQRPNTDVCGR